MHTYIFLPTERKYEVGFFDPRGTPAMPDHSMWHCVIECDNESDAQDWVNYLNGGPRKPVWAVKEE